MTWFVYALIDPRDNAIRYVGKSSNPAKRLAAHRSRAGARAVREWIADVGADPLLRILGETNGSETEALLLEQGWIARLRAEGIDLLNARSPEPAPKSERPSFSGFGVRMAARRKALGVPLAQLADRLGLDRGNLWRVEHSQRPNVSADVAILVARALGTTVEWLVTGEELASKAG